MSNRSAHSSRVPHVLDTTLNERHLDLATDDGTMQTYVVHPESGGPHPVVLFLMDAPGKRELLHAMARRIAAHGYFVMLPNLYYRQVDSFELDFSSKDSLARMSELMRGVGNRMVGRDAAALLQAAESDVDADAERVGVVGYCMSGPFAVWIAAEYAERVKAAASFYGVRLHVDSADSPHTRLSEIDGELYIAAAEHDDYVPLDMIDRFEAAMQNTEARGRVERYWGMHHGFAFDDRPAHDPVGEARHWARLFDLLDRNLQPQQQGLPS
ncbi:putative hydrolase [Ilumatobacter coccineus YM16-304]|uniref:Putative hydrolase n=1 Tax=Ilumatobacter coccineus (strain NBRC 103263 / KCTC 29153 / YM16-304) TaxID=1313172 RepID=A0A6C7E7E2_ILUCY|nr:putative hydrolase [Ilumatobacter coccineus YM16-304]